MRTKYTIYPNINSIFFLNIIKFKTTKYLSSIEEFSVGLDSVPRVASAFFPVFRALFTGHTSTKKKTKQKEAINLCSTALFTYLKIILLQYFQQ